MRDVHGIGYGSSHNWKRGDTSGFKSTYYKCANCGVVFYHNYDVVLNIFDAIKGQDIPGDCAVKS